MGVATKRTLGNVVQEAAQGAFTLATLRTLPGSEADKVEAARRESERIGGRAVGLQGGRCRGQGPI